MSLKVKSAESCKFDLVSLGESMIRLSPPGHGRIEFAPALEVWVGGGEYNVAYALSRLGLRTGWIGGLNSSPMGAIIRNHARAVGMDVSYAVERKYDGVGKKDRIGLNFTEVGVAKRGSVTLYDRGHTATRVRRARTQSRHIVGRDLVALAEPMNHACYGWGHRDPPRLKR